MVAEALAQFPGSDDFREVLQKSIADDHGILRLDIVFIKRIDLDIPLDEFIFREKVFFQIGTADFISQLIQHDGQGSHSGTFNADKVIHHSSSLKREKRSSSSSSSSISS